METNNYTLIKILRSSISPICAMIGTSAYYGQVIANPVLGSINSLLFGKKLGLDIWNLNQRHSYKTKLLNSSKKILLGLGTIGIVNYAKFTNTTNPIEPTTTPIPITTTSTTTVDPFPPDLLLSNPNTTDNHLMDWDTFISLNSYGIANLVAGITELIPSKFETIRKIANMATGGTLISSGVAMGINNDFNNAYAVPTIIAGASEIIHNLLPMETTHHNEEMQETAFNNETANLINDSISQYGATSEISESNLRWDYSHMSL
ncbi:hypothetical protein [Spiroplasma endosymbiont of Tiphia femorata]|uniref:hypothetical protein n=1 Tax=Spiroplasma endosymbiont of Tiphia femorata TaxID=3066326 RepID=UPI0030D3D638